VIGQDKLPEDYDALKVAFIEMRAKVRGAFQALLAWQFGFYFLGAQYEGLFPAEAPCHSAAYRSGKGICVELQRVCVP
jgi:hypothetical protein